MILRLWGFVSSLLLLSSPVAFATGQQNLAEVAVKKGDGFLLRLVLPQGFKLNDRAPNLIRLIEIETQKVLSSWDSKTLKNLVIQIPNRVIRGDPLLLEGNIFICEKENARICLTKRFKQRVRFSLNSSVTELLWSVSAPESTGKG